MSISTSISGVLSVVFLGLEVSVVSTFDLSDPKERSLSP